ncbi:MAG: hypothetical protein H8F28_25535 [Fibrella sp.]|nr:hypothetical protein [Armatimonadota bacterium]
MFHFRVKPLGCLSIAGAFAALGVFAFITFRSRTVSPPASAASVSTALVAGFTTLRADDPVIKTAILSDGLSEVRKRVGEQGAVLGTVVQSSLVENRKDTLLYFAGDEAKTVLIVVGDDERPLFPDLNGLIGRKILVDGEFFSYKGRPAVRVMAPAKLRILVP